MLNEDEEYEKRAIRNQNNYSGSSQCYNGRNNEKGIINNSDSNKH